MSLDVMLLTKNPISKKGTGVFIRRNGANVELTVGEVREHFPDAVIEEKDYETECVYEANITHNLNKMADAAGIYEALWRPFKLKEGYNIPENDYDAQCEFEENTEVLAKEIIPALMQGLHRLKLDLQYFSQFDSPNGWGTYEQFVPFVENYLNACREYPEAIVKTDR